MLLSRRSGPPSAPAPARPALPRPRRRRLSVLAALLALVALAPGCESGRETVGPEIPAGETWQAPVNAPAPTGGPTSPRLAPLVGTWSRVVFFNDQEGTPFSAETRFEFFGDGLFRQTSATVNLSLGVEETAVASGAWTVAGNELVLTYTFPSRLTVRFPFRVQRVANRTVLFLGEAEFVRVG